MFSKKFLVGAGALAVCPFIIGCKDNGCKGDGCKNENFCGDLGYACPDGQSCMMGVKGLKSTQGCFPYGYNATDPDAARTCTKDSNCKAGETCRTGFCLPDFSNICVQDSDCNNGEICQKVDGVDVCRPKGKDDTNTNSDVNTDAYSDEYEVPWESQTWWPGGECKTDTDCETKFGKRGKCQTMGKTVAPYTVSNHCVQGGFIDCHKNSDCEDAPAGFESWTVCGKAIVKGGVRMCQEPGTPPLHVPLWRGAEPGVGRVWDPVWANKTNTVLV